MLRWALIAVLGLGLLAPASAQKWDTGATWARGSPSHPKRHKWATPAPVKSGRMKTAFPSTTVSTINPNIPTQGTSLLSQPIRANFAAAAFDIKNIYAQFATPTNFLTAGTGITITPQGLVSTAGVPNTSLAAMCNGCIKGNNSGATGTPLDLTGPQVAAILAPNFVAKTGDTMAGALTVVASTSAQPFISYVALNPSDFAAGKPGLLFQHGNGAQVWQIALWDGTNSNGTLNIAAQFLTANGFPLRGQPINTQFITSSAATLNVDISQGEYIILTLNASITTLTISGYPPCCILAKATLEVRNGGAFNITNWSGAIWAGGTLPTVTSGAGKKDIYTIVSGDGGTIKYGNVVGQNFF